MRNQNSSIEKIFGTIEISISPSSIKKLFIVLPYALSNSTSKLFLLIIISIIFLYFVYKSM